MAKCTGSGHLGRDERVDVEVIPRDLVIRVYDEAGNVIERYEYYHFSTGSALQVLWPGASSQFAANPNAEITVKKQRIIPSVCRILSD